MVIRKHFAEVELEKVDMEGATGTSIRWLIAKKDGAENFAMRMFELEKDAHTPEHVHEWEHEVFVLEGSGVLATEDGDFSLNPNDFAFVPDMRLHQFRNTGDGVFKFLCVVPIKE
ncbi:cupin domain-containing protein [Candidatus Calescamantes bacterium]|nr:cupin domain-containing protein [Candidatus Calescamantes bacterium]MCK5598389.1 cupin domain-containing protein [bacterium]